MEKIKIMISDYQIRLNRKAKLIKVYHDKKSKFIELQQNEEITMMVLESEIRQLIEFIEDLQDAII